MKKVKKATYPATSKTTPLRKRDVEELKESRERYSAIFDQSPIAIEFYDSAGCLINVNSACINLFGVVNRNEISGLKLFENPNISKDIKTKLLNRETVRFEAEFNFEEVKRLNLYQTICSGIKILDMSIAPLINDTLVLGYIAQIEDITERKKAEEALRVSNLTVRKKLAAIVEQDGDIGTLNLADIIDFQAVQSLMDDFYRVTKIGIGIFDIHGKVLVAVDWQDICTKFHRVHPDTLKNCNGSDTALASGVPAGTFKVYHCKNNMWDMVTPIEVGGRHLGNVFFGQLFYENEIPDYELFRKQARQHGFDETEYLAAIDRVPRWKRETVDAIMAFYAKLAGMISSLSYKTIQLSRAISQKDIALRQLGESEARYKTLVENIPQKIFMKNRDYEYMEINENFARDLGISPEKIVGKVDYDFFSKELADKYRADDVRIFKTGKAEELEERYVVAGKETWVNTVKTPVRDKNGEIVGLLGIFRDITERKQAEEALQASETRFKTMFNGAPLGIALIDSLTGHIYSVNPMFSKIAGRSMEEMAHIDWMSITHPDDVQEDLDNMALLNAGKVPGFQMEKRYLLPDGTPVWINMTIAPIYVEDKAQPRHLCMIEDITERKEIEAGLEKTRQELAVIKMAADEVSELAENVINTVREPLIALDQDLRVVKVSSSFYEFFKVEPENTVGQLIYDLGNKQWDIPKLRELLETIIPQKATFDNYEVEHDFATIGKRTMLLNARQIQRVLGKERIILLAIEDITERKRAEDKLHGVLTELERSNKDLEQFASIASHDLQEPLRMVASYTQLLAERYENQLDEKAKKYIAYAVEGAIRMQRLVNDLLVYSRVSTRGNPLETTDSHSILGEVIRNLAAAIEESKAIVTNEELPMVRADASQIEQVFQNLLANAIKFRGENSPHIHVSVRDEGREWVFSVRDNGIGIERQYADRIFVIFQRLHTRQEYPGTGIGLAVCKRIVERHGGRIWFESVPGKGSTFFFTVPK